MFVGSCVRSQFVIIACCCACVRWCPGCRKRLPIADFDFDCPMDRACKYNRDMLYTIAKNNSELFLLFCFVESAHLHVLSCVSPKRALKSNPGDLVWFNSNKSDPDKLFFLLKNYRDHKAAVDKGTAAQQKFSFAQAKATIARIFSTEFKDNGEMMNKRRFCVWSSDPHSICFELLFVRVFGFRSS